MSLEKYNLTWHTYTDHLKEMMKDLMENSSFADVSLICEDMKIIRAHKNILSACSPILKGILAADPSSHCNIYLKGVNHSELHSILQFIYLGEASFHETRVNEFLSLAKSLEIKELSRDVEPNVTEAEASEEFSNDNTDQEELGQPTVTVMTEDQEVELNQEIGQEVLKGLDNKFSCKSCGKEFKNSLGVKHHVKTVHKRIRYPCSQCDYQATQKSSLKTHVDAHHEGIKYQCKFCEKQFTYQGTLATHVQSDHEGVKYACKQCDYQAAQPSNLRIHMQSKHEGVRYACNYCDHQASDQSNLKRHIQRKHEGISYKCSFTNCNAEFSYKGDLTQHSKMHHS